MKTTFCGVGVDGWINVGARRSVHTHHRGGGWPGEKWESSAVDD